VEDHVWLTALELGDERRQIRGRGRVGFVDDHLEAGLGRPFGGALGDVGAIGSVLVDDGDLQAFRVLAELRLRIGGDHLGGGQAPLAAVGLRTKDVLQVRPSSTGEAMQVVIHMNFLNCSTRAAAGTHSAEE